jgi:hypothetical protein
MSTINNEIEKNLISSFIVATKANKITWNKDNDRGLNCFYYNLPNIGKALTDKYYSKSDNDVNECFNFTILNATNEIILEIAECRENEPSHIYLLLKDLYNEVETQFHELELSKISPILTEITGSLQL